MLLCIIQSEAIYNRIAKAVPEVERGPYLRGIGDLQRYLVEHSENHDVLLDIRFRDFDGARALLGRSGMTYSLFEGDLSAADLWVQYHSGTTESSETKDVETTTELNMEQHSEEIPPLEPAPREIVRSSSRRRSSLLASFNNSLGASRKAMVTDAPEPESHRKEPAPLSIEPNIQVPAIGQPVAMELQVPSTIEIPTTLRPRLVVVTGLWRRSGVTFTSMNLAYFLSRSLSAEGSVSLVEHPSQTPYHWVYWRLDERVNNRYTHWLEDTRSQPVPFERLALVPLPHGYVARGDSEDKTIQYVYRELRRPFVIIDAGSEVDNSLLEIADDIVLVVEADPVRIDTQAYSMRYKEIYEMGTPVHVVLNKWTRFAQLKDTFPSAVFVPYFNPEVIQKAAWAGTFPTAMPEVTQELQHFSRHFIDEWIPKTLQVHEDNKKSFLFWRRK